MALGPLLATMALLSVAVIPNLVHRQSERVAERVVERGEVGTDGGSTLAVVDVDWFGDTRVHRIAISAAADAAPPSWLDEFPAAGEQVVSPALRDRIRSDGRFAGTYAAAIVGELPADVLAAPNELVTVLGVEPASLENRGQTSAAFAGFGGRGADGPSTRAVRVMSVGLVLFVVLPVLALLIATAQLSTRRRQTRLATLSLIGLSPHHVRVAGAAETVMSACAGSVLGVVSWLMLRPLSQDWRFSGVGWWADDVRPGWITVVAVVAIVSAISVAVSMSVAQAAIARDRELAANSREVTRVRWRLALVAIGALLVVACWIVIPADGTTWFVVFAVGNTFLVLGLIALAPTLATASSRILATQRSSLPATLASRRLRHSPASTNRSIGGLAVIVLIVAISQVVLTTLDWAANRDNSQDATTTLSLRWGNLSEADLLGIEGVQAVLARQDISTGNDFVPVTFATCADLETFAVEISSGCLDDTVFGIGPVEQVAAALETGSRVQPDVLAERGSEILSVVAPANEHSTRIASDWLVAIDPASDPQHIERQIVRLSPATQIDDNRSDDERGRQISTYRTAVGWALGVGFLISVAAAVVASASAGFDRRRELQVLSAIGLPRRLLARSELRAVLAPVILAVAVTAAAALLSAQAYLSLDDQETITLNAGRLVAVFVLAACAMVAVVVSQLAATLLEPGARGAPPTDLGGRRDGRVLSG